MELPAAPFRLALLGAGTIAGEVAAATLDGRLPGVRITAVAGSSPASASARRLAERSGARSVAAGEVHEGADAVLEAAGGAAAARFLPGIWRAGTDTIVLSVGALLEPEVAAAAAQFRARGGVVLRPPGALAGLDGVTALAAAPGGGLRTVSLTTVKAPAALQGAPWLLAHGIRLPADRRVQAFSGSARDAARGFPANANVAAALSLAGLGPDRTRVTIFSDPAAQRTTHTVEAEGAAGRLKLALELLPSPANPRTSWLAALSAVSAVRQLQAGRARPS